MFGGLLVLFCFADAVVAVVVVVKLCNLSVNIVNIRPVSVLLNAR